MAIRIFENHDLARRTTFHLPVKARCYAEYESVGELLELLDSPHCRQGKVMSIGQGSNMLFACDYDGTLLHSCIEYIEVADETDDDVTVRAGSGTDWDRLVAWCVERGFHGVENLSLIPGTVGASAVQNIGAYGVEAKDVISEVVTIDTTTGEERRWAAADCHYGYRDSIFKSPSVAGRYVVTEVSYRLSKRKRLTLEYGPLRELAEHHHEITLADVRDRVVEIRRAKLPDPMEIGSAGSFFKNPIVAESHLKAIENEYGDIPYYKMESGYKIPAGWLIEHAGMKGVTVGDAQVYPKQCLVLVNRGRATADDVLALKRKVTGEVAFKYHVVLEPEVNIIGDSPHMHLRFLGTGTSTGVPMVGCSCPTCKSSDSRNCRMRTSALLEVGDVSLLIDCGPDFRQQALAAGSPWVDAVLLTHSHYDHVGGMDDLRPYCAAETHGLPVYCRQDVIDDIRARLPYCFKEPSYPGVPKFHLIPVSDKPFEVKGLTVEPLSVMHYRLPIIGFKVGGLAYITDAKVVPDETMEKIRGIDTLVINALRHREHLSHMNLSQALEVISKVKPRVAYLIHLSHDMGLHGEVEPTLPEGVKVAYDGLEIEIPR